MEITGYCIPTTEISKVEEELAKIKRKIDKLASSSYQQLFGEQAAFLYDQMALNVLKLPDNRTFFEWVKAELEMRIHFSQQNAIPNDFNMNVFIYVMEENEKTYLKVLCSNRKLIKAFKHLEEYSLNTEESKDEKNGKNIFWTCLQRKYENRPILSLNLTPSPEPIKKEIVLPTHKQRCETIARHDVTNCYLRLLAGNNSIPPYMMMPLLDEALTLLMNEHVKPELKNKEMQLANILPKGEEILKLLYPEPSDADID